MPRVENSIEDAVRKAIVKWAKAEGIKLEYRKLVIPGYKGWPDRMILWQGGHTLFIEFKQPGEEPRPLQEFVHKELRAMGFTVEVHDDRDIALAAIKEKVRATLRAGQGHEAHSNEQGEPPVPAARQGQDGDRS